MAPSPYTLNPKPDTDYGPYTKPVLVASTGGPHSNPKCQCPYC